MRKHSSRPVFSTTDPVQELAKHGQLAELQALHAEGHPMDEPDARGDTPLLYAVFNGQGDTWRWLLRVGANVSHANHKGHTAIHHLTRRFKSGGLDATLKDFDDLVAAGATVDGLDNEGYSALLLESRRGQNINTVRDGSKKPRMALMLRMAHAGADVMRRAPDGLDMSDLFDEETHKRLLAAQRLIQSQGKDFTPPLPKRVRLRT